MVIVNELHPSTIFTGDIPKTSNKVTCSKPLTEIIRLAYLSNAYRGETEDGTSSESQSSDKWIKYTDIAAKGVPENEYEYRSNDHHY